jgi:hypothetical protein
MRHEIEVPAPKPQKYEFEAVVPFDFHRPIPYDKGNSSPEQEGKKRY